MAAAGPKPTMTALRATHQAFRIAVDVGYKPVDVERLTCPSCGAEVEWKSLALPWYCYDLPCQRCGAVVTLPCHLRAHALPRRDEDLAKQRLGYRGIQYQPLRAWLVRFVTLPDLSAPRWFVWMFLLCILSIIAAWLRLVPHH